MRVRFYSSLIFLLSLTVNAQNSSDIGVWLDHLPYGKGVEVIQSGNFIYGAVEQGIFRYNKADRVIERLSKLNGLSDVSVKAMALHPNYNQVIIGYENANMDIIDGDQIVNIRDIFQSSNFPGLKTINHILPYEDKAYLSTDFGIVVFEMDRRFVQATYVIGDEGATIKVNQVAINPLNDSIYAATDEGILKASLNSPLQAFQSWTRDDRKLGVIKHITFFADQIMFTKEGLPNLDSVFFINNGVQHFTAANISIINQLRTFNDHLTICNGFSAQGFDQNLNRQYNVNSVNMDFPEFNPQGALVDTDRDLFWSIDANKGLFFNYRTNFNDNVLPNSPRSNKVYTMSYADGRLFVGPGEISSVWGPLFNNEGYFVLEDFEWTNYNNEDFQGLKDIITIIVDPIDPKRHFVSSYGLGIGEFYNYELVRLIDKQSVGSDAFPSMTNDEHRVGGFAADPDGNIWFTNSFTDLPLGRIAQDGTVESFSLGAAAGAGDNIRDIMYTTNDQIWIQTRTQGIVVVKFDNGQILTQKLVATENQGNLPTERVLTFAEDADGEIWIGTDEGIGVLYSPQNIFEANRNFDAQSVLFEEDGVVQRLLGSETVNDIKIDGSNKKWFATATSGVFYTSEDGQEQIYHFTKENSPLISNNVLEIEIDDETGMVYFGTDQGIVSFQGTATEGVETHSDVFAYPNPVQPDYKGPILIRGLVTNAQVKITDIEGNIIFETVAEGGQAIWSGNSFSGQRAKSGVYLAYITDDLGTQTAVAKILIVN